jgi:hypothetical protein
MNTQVKFGGMGGHMDISLLHQIAYEKRIARIQINNLLADGQTQAAYQRGQARDRKVSILKNKLRERGYYWRIAQAEKENKS